MEERKILALALEELQADHPFSQELVVGRKGWNSHLEVVLMEEHTIREGVRLEGYNDLEVEVLMEARNLLERLVAVDSLEGQMERESPVGVLAGVHTGIFK